ncbi:hypothetical protein CAC42_4176 [Sphaceloma murrayae]|uniref:DUF4185 domain-containing protein n=1 Tax=Sphaceloma murrayae TaxID=2082308 RepID=A0A2K1QKP5_9PEZI|nr:hypothetical protein CAC42_4176 [Sphaceloma murrayae]
MTFRIAAFRACVFVVVGVGAFFLLAGFDLVWVAGVQHGGLREVYVKNGQGMPDAVVSVSLSPSTSATTLGTHKPFPSVADWKAQNGSLWTLSYVGKLKYTDQMADKNLQGDKCRTGSIGGRVIWSCGDMECAGGVSVCGFSMGPAFYGTSDPMTVDTDGVSNPDENLFARAWEGDPRPVAPQWAWGMDTSNVAEINATHGVAFVWEIWRGASDGNHVDRGAGAVSVTLGPNRPVAARVGPLLSDAKALQVGLIGIMRDGEYIYSYSSGGPSNVVVGRVRANDDVFSPSAYEFLRFKEQTWERTGGIISADARDYGARTANAGGRFGCAVYGSVFWSDAWGKYVLLCNIFMHFTKMHVADKPEGPWSAEYPILGGVLGYGSHAHPEFGTNPLYFSQGPNGPFDVYKITTNFPE